MAHVENISVLSISINNQSIKLDIDPETPLLWVLREKLALTGTKFSCGKGLCGACTVLMDNKPIRSCMTPINKIQDRQITTIEGISKELLQSVVEAWLEAGASECGYCQPGQVMSALALLMKNPKPSDTEIDQAMAGNLCRCGIYQRIRKAVHNLASTGIHEKAE